MWHTRIESEGSEPDRAAFLAAARLSTSSARLLKQYEYTLDDRNISLILITTLMDYSHQSKQIPDCSRLQPFPGFFEKVLQPKKITRTISYWCSEYLYIILFVSESMHLWYYRTCADKKRDKKAYNVYSSDVRAQSFAQ